MKGVDWWIDEPDSFGMKMNGAAPRGKTDGLADSTRGDTINPRGRVGVAGSTANCDFVLY